MPAHDNHLATTILPAPPVIRCKTCKTPLPDTTWKNCASCRKNRTESYHRWKKSAAERSKMGTIDLTISSSTSEFSAFFFFDSCATTLNPERTFIFILSSCLLRIVDSATSLQAPGPTAPVNQYLNVEPNHYGNPSGSSRSSRLADDQPQLTSASTAPRPPPSKPIEYQWSDDLIEALLALPPRSGYIGKFSIVADPTVNNHTRARLFTRQLRDRAVHISCVVVPSPASTFPQDHVALTFLFFLSVLTQGPITADFPGHGQQQFFLAPVILHLSGRVSGSVRHLC